MDTVQILKEARALIADEKNWTQFALARDKDDMCVDVDDPRAVCFCSDGALRKVITDADGPSADFAPAYYHAMQVLGDVVPQFNIVALNDGGSHPEVISAFDRAIARSESEAA